MRAPFTLLLLTGCGAFSQRIPEDPDEWFDSGTQIDVEEAIAFTDEPYDFDGGIGNLRDRVYPVGSDITAYPPGQKYPAGRCKSSEDPDLPMEIEGVVTILPRLYFKSRGCDRDSDEKYYGSFFIQDGEDAIFVLGDTKVHHFMSGNRVRMNVTAGKTTFDLDMVYNYELLEVDRDREPIYYEEQTRAFQKEDIAKVRRVRGEVITSPDTFGQFAVKPLTTFGTCTPDPEQQAGCFLVAIDSELTRRGFAPEVGDDVIVTGPVLYAYSTYTVTVMEKGQLEIVD